MALSSEESMGNNALRFSKLNSSNYKSWAFNMRLYLEAMDFGQLREMDCTMAGKELGMTFLANLQSKFKQLLTELETVSEANLSFEKVKGMLLTDFDCPIDSIRPEDAFSMKRPQFHKKGKKGNTYLLPKKRDSKQERFLRSLSQLAAAVMMTNYIQGFSVNLLSSQTTSSSRTANLYLGGKDI